jgi:hypothetical protein
MGLGTDIGLGRGLTGAGDVRQGHRGLGLVSLLTRLCRDG